MIPRYRHTILVPKEIVFKPEYRDCPFCGKQIQKHIFCEGAYWHMPSWDNKGRHCSEPDCEDNHGKGKCC